MKKLILGCLFLLLLSLAACTSVPQEVEYSDDEPIVLAMKNETLKILQITDLHLTYGIDAYDRKTFDMIETLVNSDDFDLIVISGDMTMSISAPSLFKRLVAHMESLETPWTFVFGNHETDYHEYADFINLLGDTEFLHFKVGPEMVDGGYGNFVIQFTKEGIPFYEVYLLDSHSEREEYTEEEGEYGYLSTAQVEWYESHVSLATVDSVVFMHIPLRQFIDPVEYFGTFNEDKVYAQGVDTGFFDAMVLYGKSKGIFVGHDHLNNFYLNLNGIMLAYGQISGYSAYGDLERGGRVIVIGEDQTMSSYILLESEAE
jgi:3',5'-cyclic AMP phosphodiesterase CpdA